MTWADASRHELARLYVALMLTPEISVAEALLRDESVPLDRLCSWVERFAIREGLPARVCLDDFETTPTRRRRAA